MTSRATEHFVTNTNVLERFTPTGGNNQSYKVDRSQGSGQSHVHPKPIVVDGVREAAWDDATRYPIANKFNAAMTADAPAATRKARCGCCGMGRCFICWWR